MALEWEENYVPIMRAHVRVVIHPSSHLLRGDYMQYLHCFPFPSAQWSDGSSDQHGASKEKGSRMEESGQVLHQQAQNKMSK